MSTLDESPLVESNSSPEPATAKVTAEPQTETKSYTTYLVYFLCFAVVVLLIWYMHDRFVDNSGQSISEPFEGEKKQEGDETAQGFDLHEEVDKINRKQKKILSGLSQSTGM